ncbi:hypothetical protein FIBSPDRAFT_889718 [Athelia psychrophila]|uniref:Uncharacterized protein n=1 Tax=Athelia psychrophila TaxID=1759441 RepID=A0A166LUU1_9AGAM|nr:hypothetical protein FIBSPDRAFT_889718 [Fibularhizoctonia sp. CBS 109695]
MTRVRATANGGRSHTERDRDQEKPPTYSLVFPFDSVPLQLLNVMYTNPSGFRVGFRLSWLAVHKARHSRDAYEPLNLSKLFTFKGILASGASAARSRSRNPTDNAPLLLLVVPIILPSACITVQNAPTVGLTTEASPSAPCGAAEEPPGEAVGRAIEGLYAQRHAEKTPEKLVKTIEVRAPYVKEEAECGVEQDVVPLHLANTWWRYLAGGVRHGVVAAVRAVHEDEPALEPVPPVALRDGLVAPQLPLAETLHAPLVGGALRRLPVDAVRRTEVAEVEQCGTVSRK